MLHHLEDRFEVCSNYVHGNKMAGAGVTFFYICFNNANLEISSSL